MRSSSEPYYGSGRGTPGALDGMVQPSLESPYRQFAAEDQDIRSPSLTSIVEMYQGQSSDGVVHHMRSPRSHFYDYSEEFDQGSPEQLQYGSPAYPPQSQVKDLSGGCTIEDTRRRIGAETKGTVNYKWLYDTD